VNWFDTATKRALVLPLVIGLAACAGKTKKSESLSQVDDLLARVERVHVETVVSKETAHTALGSLHALVAPKFNGDPTAAHGELMTGIDRSETQARTLRSAVEPMGHTADRVFERWTTDLQAIGNSKLRQRSQTRLEETRSRYNEVVVAAKAAQIAYDAFNADLRDHALFLGSDFNSSAVDEIRPEVHALTQRIKELDERFDACSAAAQAYIQAFALHGQIGEETEEEAPRQTQTNGAQGAATTTAPARRPVQKSGTQN
jgi:hypothetical protein